MTESTDHDRSGNMERSVCAVCGGAHIECVRCGVYVCECDTTCATGSESTGSGNMARCGYTLVDEDGEEYPCNEPATGWRWYQDVPHEDALEPACWHHANEGGRRIHAAESAAAAVERVAQRVEARIEHLLDFGDTTACPDLGWVADDLRAILRDALRGTP